MNWPTSSPPSPLSKVSFSSWMLDVLKSVYVSKKVLDIDLFWISQYLLLRMVLVILPFGLAAKG
jgi:hypothetical protein